MHPNRKKISDLKISPRGRKSKKSKKTRKRDIIPITKTRPKKKNKLKITSSILGKWETGDRIRYKSLSGWNGLLKGHVAFILGNAPSIAREDLKLLNPYFTIGTNRIFYIYDPTVLLWQDKQVWNSDKKNIIRQQAIKMSSSTGDPGRIFINFRVLDTEFTFGSNIGVLHGKGNTGVLAVQVAVALGCSDIVLLGTDCKYGKGRKTDFYGKNRDHKPYTLKMCKAAMKWVDENCPVPIHNCSDNRLWDKEKLSDVIKKLKPKKMDRNQYRKIFKR
ncbi:MAG: hypothetical protein ACTSSP_02115 [Candidatus Asgardarchaeia archaeon]